MHITIAKAKPADAAAVLDFLKQVGGETDNLSFGAQGLPIGVEAEASFLEALERSRDDVMLVAKADGRIIANGSVNRLPRRMSHRAEISIAVARGYWNLGIGGQLIGALLDFARQSGVSILDLQVRSDNLAAIHLYEKFGFVKLFTDPAFFCVGGENVAFDYMRLCL